MSNIHEEPDEMPTTEELEEPSTEKEPGEEPRVEHPDEPEPDHEAVGIGVVGGPQSETADAAHSQSGEEDQPS